MKHHFDIADFGARPGGEALNTAAIQKAIDACHAAGGGRVVCGPGTWRTGTLTLKSHVDLHLSQGCRLLGSTDLKDYREFVGKGFRPEFVPEGSSKSLLAAADAEDIAITGTGEVNGQGPSFFDTSTTLWEHFYAKPPTARPRMLTLYRCRDVRIEGPAFVDSPCWTFWLMKCERVHIHRIRILADQRMINNDGIDLDACRDVTVSDCIFKTGDDCIAVRSIRSVFDAPGVCENLVVSNCVLDSFSEGIRIGCPSDGIIRNCTFANLVIRSHSNGIACDHPRGYLCPPGSAGTAVIHDVLFSNVVIDCGKTPIKVAVAEGIALPRLEGLSFQHVRIRSGGPCVVQGNAATTIRDVSFSHMTIETAGEEAVLRSHCEGVTLHEVRLVKPPSPAP